MAKEFVAEMPRAWEDAEGWERYYAELTAEGKNAKALGIGAFSDRIINMAREQLKKGPVAVWIPGIGCSGLGRVMAHCGIDVWVTDISPSAIAFQREISWKRTAEIASHSKFSPGETRGSFVAEVHDSRTEYRRESFVYVVSHKAVQGFTVENQGAIARQYFAAMRKKGIAFVSTQNLQGDARDHFERAFADAGFIVPLIETREWHRQKLRETGIPYAEVLGRMMPQYREVYKNDPRQRNRDAAALSSFDEEAKKRGVEEWERQRGLIEREDARIFQAIHGTG